jgi:hypothetical protein
MRHLQSNAVSTVYLYLFIYIFCCCGPMWAMASSFMRFLDHTQWYTTIGRTPLDEWSALPRDLYLTTHTRGRHRCSRQDLKPTVSAGEQPQTYALDCTATGTSCCNNYCLLNSLKVQGGHGLAAALMTLKFMLPDTFTWVCTC